MSLKAVWVPGLPHLMNPKTSTHWQQCAKAMAAVGERIANEKFERIVLYSTQWLSVLGTSFQADPNPKGFHVDDNWYDLGDLAFDFKVDEKLAHHFTAALKEAKLPAKSVRYEGFPIDTGTIVALSYLNPKKIPVSIVSSWVYADAEKSERVGELMAEEVKRSHKKTLFVVSSLLSTRYFTEDIDPQADRVSLSSDDDWNRKMLSLWEKGSFAQATEAAEAYAAEAKVDMRWNGFHWLQGVIKNQNLSGRVVHYGPIWGTGAAVVEFYEN